MDVQQLALKDNNNLQFAAFRVIVPRTYKTAGTNCIVHAIGGEGVFPIDGTDENKLFLAGDLSPLDKYYKGAGFRRWKTINIDYDIKRDKDKLVVDKKLPGFLKVEPGVEKVVVFGRVKFDDGLFKTTKIREINHAARQLPSGKWLSKLGPDGGIIEHEILDLQAAPAKAELEGTYGIIVAIYTKKVKKK